jgi:hypothetical protein
VIGKHGVLARKVAVVARRFTSVRSFTCLLMAAPAARSWKKVSNVRLSPAPSIASLPNGMCGQNAPRHAAVARSHGREK